MDPVADGRMQDFLRPGIVAADLPDLHPLLSARGLLRAFSTLFHGGEEMVMVRLLVLRAIGERGAAPDWSPQELRDHFAYLDPVKFDTVLLRLRENELLLWDGEAGRYRISPVGRQALAALGMLLEFNREGDELAYATAQLAAGQAAGRIRADHLQHVLSRLNELRRDFDRAVLSGSEHRIHRAANTLQTVWKWVEKGTRIIESIAADEELDAATHRVAQQIGRAQSAMLRQAGVFQRALNQLDRHRVHLGASGLSSSDVNRYLRALDADALAALADDVLARGIAPAFALAPIALDIAEYELVERAREAAEDQRLPEAQDTPADAAIPIAAADYREAEDWLAQLSAIEGEVSLADLVPEDDFALSAYRFSLLGLIGDPGAENRAGVSAGIARLPLRWRIEPAFDADGFAPVGRAGVAAISRGGLRPWSGDDVSTQDASGADVVATASPTRPQDGGRTTDGSTTGKRRTRASRPGTEAAAATAGIPGEATAEASAAARTGGRSRRRTPERSG